MGVEAFPVFEQGGVAGIFCIEKVCLREEAESFAGGEQVFESGGIGREKLDGFFGGAKVEEGIAKGEIEEFALPEINAVFGAEGGGIGVKRLGAGEISRGEFESGRKRCRRKWRDLGSGVFVVERLDAVEAAAVDIEDEFEIVVVFESDGAAGTVDGRSEGDRAVREQGGLKKDQVLELEAIAKRGGVVDDWLIDFDRLEPAAGESVAALDDDDGADAGEFEGGCKQECEIETGGNSLLEDLGGGADFLARVFEAGGRESVSEPELGESQPEGRTDLPDAIGAGGFTIE